MKNISPTFGERLKKVRKEKGISAKGFAKSLSFCYSSYTKYENNSVPSFERMIEIIKTLKVSFDYFFEPYYKDIEIDREFLKIISNLKLIEKSDEHWPTMKNVIQLCYQSIKDKEKLSKKRDTRG